MRFLYDGELLDLPSGRVDHAADAVLLPAAGSVIELGWAMDFEHIPRARGWGWERRPRRVQRRYALGVDAR